MTNRIFTTILAACLWALTSCTSTGVAPPTSAKPTLPESLAGPDIFKRYSTEKPAKWKGGWVRHYDFSGVSFDQRRTATLVTPQHVVMAKHYQRRVGDDIVLHDRSGAIVKRKLVDVRDCTGDIAVGLLDAVVPSSVHVYPLPKVTGDPRELVGRIAAVTDQERGVYFHQVGAVRDRKMFFVFDRLAQHGWSKTLVGGDSGNPSFFLEDGQLVLIETHSHGGPGCGPFYGDPAVQRSLQRTISSMSPGAKLSYAKVEPAKNIQRMHYAANQAIYQQELISAKAER